jgi:hypothetical protein
VFFENVAQGEEGEFPEEHRCGLHCSGHEEGRGCETFLRANWGCSADRGDTYRNRGHEEGVGSRRQAGGPR